MSDARELGVVGLGRIGGGIARQALALGLRVAGYSRSGPSADLVAAGLTPAPSLAALVAELRHPRVIVLYIPAGPAIDETADRLAELLDPGDTIVDGGNSYWGDSRRRAARVAQRGIHWVDAGTSGGVVGARTGACFMVGGTDDAVARVEPLLRPLAVAGGWVHAGPPGAGHFVKLVHNGIEFGMLQAIGEGVGLLEGYPDALPIGDILRCWRNGSVIRGWLIELLDEGYRAEGGLDAVPSHVEDTGEVNWLVEDALRLEVPVPVIAQAVMQLLASRDPRMSWARAVAVMRHGFGDHPFGPVPEIAEERATGRVGS